MITDDHLARLPVFPLPGVVFFPNTVLPLHVFEPRYRALTRYCLENDWPMAVPMIVPGKEAEQSGSPELEPVAGVGKITHHQEMDDGRFGIVLSGYGRVRIEAEHRSDLPYRLVQASLVADRGGVSPDAEAEIQTIRECLTVLRARIPNLVDALSSLTVETSPGALADRLASILFRDPEQRQALLANDQVDERLTSVRHRVAALAARTASPNDAVN